MTQTISRRSAIAALPIAATGASLSTLPAIAETPADDPIFALIAEHRAALKAFCDACSISGELKDNTPEWQVAHTVTEAASDRADELLTAVFTRQPTTLAGLAALLDYAWQPPTPPSQPPIIQDEDEDEDEEMDETMLSDARGATNRELAKAAREFLRRLAVTAGSLSAA
jgi:hypothetical protein